MMTLKQSEKGSATNTYQQAREISSFVSREVIYCVSALVSTLAQAAAETHHGELSDGTDQDDILKICVQDDYETPARENGWTLDSDKVIVKHGDSSSEEMLVASDWRDACEQDNIDPYTVEAYEHWIVTNWLAKKLEEKGEMIGRDICGLTIWGRTTTGQAISMDSVIQEIYKELQEG